MKAIKIFPALCLAVLTVVSCGKKEEKKVIEVSEEPMETIDATPAETNVLVIEGNDQMKFNLTELRAVAGKPIKLTLKHVGKMEKMVMGHNVVILKKGTNVMSFDQKAMTARETDYIPEAEKASIIAHTKLLGGGEEDTIEFTIDEKGTYDFICSFPGHATTMHGKLIVE